MAHQNSQNNTVYTIHNTSISPSFFSTSGPNNNSINSTNQRSIVFAEFQRNHLKSFSFDDIDEINPSARKNFFRENLSQHEPENNNKIVAQVNEG